jgi:glycosyltransferase involved in cell wall biosynthesis
MLTRTLEGIVSQITLPSFTFEIVVVDNDANRSAEKVVRAFQSTNQVKITYDCECERNISLARNRTIRNATGNLIAFIDDDEFPLNDWLLKMYQAYKRLHVDGILGPVKPHFDVVPPQWVIKGKLCERNPMVDGMIKSPSDTRTGNVLINRQILDLTEGPFNPSFGRSGGGDIDFFRRMMERGHTFAWCNEGVVYETVPPERLKRSYFLKRALVRGATNARNISLFSWEAMKSLIAIVIYTLSLPVLLIRGHHYFMEYLISDFDHIGKFFALLGIEFVKERPYQSVSSSPNYRGKGNKSSEQPQ